MPQDEDAGATHKVIANWTRALGIFTALLAIISSAQWYMMMQANRDTREIFLATQRPIMGAANDDAFYLGGWTVENGSPSYYRLGYHFYNSGNSNAIMRKINLVVCVTPCSGDAPYDFSHGLENIGDVVAPKSSYKIWKGISIDDLNAVANGTRTMAIIAYLEYEDTLGSGKTYHLTYCHRLSVKQGANLSAPPTASAHFDDLFEGNFCNSNNVSD